MICRLNPYRYKIRKVRQPRLQKLTCETALSDAETDIFTMKVPVSLREEYRISSVKTDYPLCQDAPLCKDWEGTGAYFWMKSGDETGLLQKLLQLCFPYRRQKQGSQPGYSRRRKRYVQGRTLLIYCL